MLPSLFERWTSSLLGGATIPEETQATCGSCAMQPAPGEPRLPRTEYFTVGKCCTWQPALHSFLAGALLLDDTPEQARGRAVLETLIDRRSGVSPLGVHGRSSYWLLYDNSASGGAFGRSSSLRCPFFLVDEGSCGVWRHRESTCATWFCKHERGVVGHTFWRALHELLMAAEYALVRHAALELDLGDEALATIFPGPGLLRTLPGEDVEGVVNEAAYRRRWGRWFGKERDYFTAAAQLVAGLEWPAVLAASGADGRVAANKLTAAFARLVDHTPPAGPLELARVDLVSHRDGVVRLKTYRDYDMIDVPERLFSALGRFDGRPTAEVVREIHKRDGVKLDPEKLQTLCDFDVLVPARR